MKSALFGRTLAASVAAAAFALVLPAAAQVIGVGTTKGGATEQVSNAVAKIVSAHSGMQMRTQPMGGTNQYIPIVNAGRLEFGLANMTQALMAYTGTGLSEGDKAPDIRLVATMMRFQVGPMVTNKSGMRTVAELKGKRAAYGFNQATLFQFVMEAFLSSGKLTWNDVTQVPHVGLQQHWDSFKAGKIDVVIAAAGTAAIQEMDTVIDGGVRYITMDSSPDGLARLQKIMPGSFLDRVEPSSGLVGVREPVHIISYDYMIFAGTKTRDDIVYKVTKALYDNEKELKETSPLWRSHSSANMAKKQEVPYHPGSEKFYKEVGIWKR